MSGETKTCWWCGMPFTVDFHHREYCSKECRERRYAAIRSRRLYGDLACRDFVKEREEACQELRVEIERLKAENSLLEHELEESKAKVQRLMSSSKPALQVDENAWHYCARMKLRQLTALPCGQRRICWLDIPCSKIPAGMSEADIVPDKQLHKTEFKLLPKFLSYLRPSYNIHDD
jgi:hypothetical protein